MIWVIVASATVRLLQGFKVDVESKIVGMPMERGTFDGLDPVEIPPEIGDESGKRAGLDDVAAFDAYVCLV